MSQSPLLSVGGLSPRERGKLPGLLKHDLVVGPIPARAGVTIFPRLAAYIT